MVFNLLLLGGSIAAAIALGWWVHRHQRDIDAYEQRGYREPPLLPEWPG
jgi:hypothetical protein